MSVEPVLRDDQVPGYVTRATTRNIVKRYGTLKFWAIKNGFSYCSVCEILTMRRAKGVRPGTQAYAIKNQMIKDGVWAEQEPQKKGAE
jgi:hypothetical protein